jgi:hypothetical protein
MSASHSSSAYPFPPSACAAATLPADSDDEVPIPHFSRGTALICVMVMLRFFSRTPVFLAYPPPPPLLLFALNLHRRLAAAADALSGMVNTDLLLLLVLLQLPLIIYSRCSSLIIFKLISHQHHSVFIS